MKDSPASGSDGLASGAPPSRSFELLHERVQRWIWREGWVALRDVQEEAVHAILSSEADLIVSAATAAGKTEAAFLPICSRLAGNSSGSVRALYIGPLKALINDQFRRLEELCRELDVRVTRWHGDASAARKRQLLKSPEGLLLITPESLEALLVLHGTKVAAVFRELGHVVVDELHTFIATERGRQLQALLHRIELSLGRRVPRIGLSATLGEMSVAARFLRPRDWPQVRLIESSSDAQELRLLVKGYERRGRWARGSDREPSQQGEGDSTAAICEDLYRRLRGQDNLVFANARAHVEVIADHLRRSCERQRVPNEFFPHHGNLAKGLREELEAHLKDGALPVTAICTSTLELGIDIGSVASVAQLGAPPSVASLRQRLGRSGRRLGEPAVLRVYVQEEALGARTPLLATLRPTLFQVVAMIQLMLEGWCESPQEGALHLSTLLQQVLAVAAERGGVRADQAFEVLCRTGPFTSVGPREFTQLLRDMGKRGLLEQSADGTLLLGPVGERIVNHYSFYVVFVTPEEYQVTLGDRTLGVLPVSWVLIPGTYLIFAGRRWLIEGVDHEQRAIRVSTSRAGRPPLFDPKGHGPVDDRVRERMRALYRSADVPEFLDGRARALFREGRESFVRLRLDERSVLQDGADVLAFPWAGDRALDTLCLEMGLRGLSSSHEPPALRIREARSSSVREALAAIASTSPSDPLVLARSVAIKATEKYDEYLDADLLSLEHASRRIDVTGARSCCERLLHGWQKQP